MGWRSGLPCGIFIGEGGHEDDEVSAEVENWATCATVEERQRVLDYFGTKFCKWAGGVFDLKEVFRGQDFRRYCSKRHE